MSTLVLQSQLKSHLHHDRLRGIRRESGCVEGEPMLWDVIIFLVIEHIPMPSRERMPGCSIHVTVTCINLPPDLIAH